MLTLLCRAFQQEGALPERRVDLYESCLRGLLRDWLALDKQADREDPKLSDSYVEAMLDPSKRGELSKHRSQQVGKLRRMVEIMHRSQGGV